MNFIDDIDQLLEKRKEIVSIEKRRDKNPRIISRRNENPSNETPKRGQFRIVSKGKQIPPPFDRF